MQTKPTLPTERQLLLALDALLEALEAWGNHITLLGTPDHATTTGRGLALRANLLRASEHYHTAKTNHYRRRSP